MAIDYELLFGGEDVDPCEAVKALRPAMYRLMTEGGTQEVRSRGETVSFNKGDLAMLRDLVAQFESQCREKRGLPRSRRAITVGGRRKSSGGLVGA